jgi:hypothetical protein
VIPLLLLAGAAHATSPAIWRLDALSNSTAAPDSTYRLNLQLANIGDEAADGTGGEPVVFTAALPPQMSVEGLQAESLFGIQHSEGITIPSGGFGILDPALLGWHCSGDGPGSPPSIEGAQNISCSIPLTIGSHQMLMGNGLPMKPTINVHVAPDAAETAPGGTLVSHFTLSGANTPATSTAELTRVAPQAAFGIDSFDMGPTDQSGKAFAKSGGFPFGLTTDLDFNTRHNPRIFAGEPGLKLGGGPAFQDASPVEAVRDVSVDLPPGLVGQAGSLPQCTTERLSTGDLNVTPDCPADSQIGTILIKLNPHLDGTSLAGPFAIYNLVPAPGSPATFGFNIYGSIVTLRARLRSQSDYGISVLAPAISRGLDVAGNSLTIWGQPGSDSHEFERSCPATKGRPEYVYPHGPSCPTEAAGDLPFLRMPTSCTAPGQGLPWSVAMDSWDQPGAFLAKDVPDLSDSAWTTAAIEGHEEPGYPLAPSEWGAERGVEDCADVPFQPSFSAQPTTDAADSPSGLDVDLTVPQNCWDQETPVGDPEPEPCQSDLRKAVVKLPEGMSINPAAAGGLGACSPDQVGLITPVGQAPAHFDAEPVTCPDASKIGSAEIDTPLLADPLSGSVYIAEQGDNPFASLLGLYLVIENPARGIEVKLPGHVVANEKTGQLETNFDENPQLPFSNLHLELDGGPRAALRTPASCGTYKTQASLAPWSGNAPVNVSSSFQITQGCGGGFDPKLEAGTQNPLAGTFSPFHLRLTRPDATQEIAGLSATLAPGLIGKPAGIPYCPDATLAAISGALGTGAAQIASPSCPAASQVGTVTVGAGAGVNPFYTSAGRAYWAGPYKGAPLSVAVVTPAVAGPFDLGTVVVRNALRIDPESTQVTAVSDPLPSILHGIPLDLRDVRVSLNRPDFTLNPTSCEAKSIDATLTSLQGTSANRSVHFQAAACDRLGFKPKLALKLKGGTKRSDHPALTAVFKARKGDANLGRVQVALPHSEFLAQSHIRTICTRVQFAAGGGGGAGCPAGSVYGKAIATSPLVDYPLTGNIYLRSSANPLPDMVLALHGPPSQPIAIDAVGQIDSKDGGIRTTFATVPDAPLTKVVLSLPGGKKSLLENSTNLCRTASKATVQMDAQNSKTYDFNAPLQPKCGKAGKDKKRG